MLLMRLYAIAMAARVEIIARGVIRHGSRVLVCRDLRGGYCYLPGGHVEFDESSPDALRREMQEEAGLDCRVGPLVLVHEQRFGQQGKRRHEINLMFHVEQLLGAPADGEGPPTVTSQEPHIGFEWLEIAAVPEADLRPTAAAAWLLANADSATPPTEFISD